MIRIILQETAEGFHLDVLDTNNGGHLDLQQHPDFISAATAINTALSCWRSASKPATQPAQEESDAIS